MKKHIEQEQRERGKLGALSSFEIIKTVLAVLVGFIICFLCLPSFAQRQISIVEWNVENLFDTMHDSLKDDTDFLPEGAYHWTHYRYWKKVNEVGQTLAAIGGDDGLPALVGLCEVENDSVLFDLTHRSCLYASGYEYVMTESADQRGIDVALMYQPFLFRLLDWHPVRVPSVQNGYKPTRDLLWAKGQFLSGDTLHLVVCHLPSKANGGMEATRHRRLATKTLRSIVDSVLMVSPEAKILVMGDFNAASTEGIFDELLPPLHETLPTGRRELSKPIGTYYYKKQWSYLDHILVSDGFIKRWTPQPPLGGDCKDESGKEDSQLRSHEVRLPFLLNKDGIPKRIFRGPSYNGGISDHLPLCLKIKIG